MIPQLAPIPFAKRKSGVPYRSDLVGYYKGTVFQDTDNLYYLKDYSGNAYHALAKDSTFHPNGTNNYVVFSGNVIPNTSDFTICCKMAHDSSAFKNMAYTLNYNPSIPSTHYGGIELYADSNGANTSINLTMYANGVSHAIVKTAAIATADAKVHSYCVSIDRSGNANFYIDGTSLGSSDISSFNGVSLNNHNLTLSALYSFSTSLYNIASVKPNGYYHDLTIFNYALSETEVAYYESITSNILFKASFNEGAGNTIYDVSGNGNHGTIYGSTSGGITGTYYSLSECSSFWNYIKGYDTWINTGTSFTDYNATLSGLTEAGGICKKGTKFLILDRSNSHVVEYDDKAELLNPSATAVQYDLSGDISLMVDICSDGTNTYITGNDLSGNRKVFIYDNTFNLTSSFAATGLSGIEYLSSYLYLIDTIANGTMYKYSTAGVLQESSEMNITEIHASEVAGGIFTYDGDFWVSDIVNNNAYSIDQTTYQYTGKVIRLYDMDNTFGGTFAVNTSGSELAVVKLGTAKIDILSIVNDNAEIYIPYKADGTPLYTNGDSLQSMLWQRTQPANNAVNNEITTFNFPLEALLITSDAYINAIYEDGWMFNAAGDTQKNITYADRNKNVLDNEVIQANIIFSDIKTYYKWKNILVYNSTRELGEIEKILRYLGYVIGSGVTYNGETITYNGNTINDMAELKTILDNRTASVTLPAGSDLTVTGADVAGDEITVISARGVVVIEVDTGLRNDNWDFAGGADPTEITIYADGVERDLYVIYNI